MRNDFTHARRKLVGIYLLIVSGIIVLFSFLVVYEANNSFLDPAVETSAEIIVKKDEAIQIAQGYQPGKEIIKTEYEILENKLYYTVSFADESEVKINLLTGDVLVPKDRTGFLGQVTDDFSEVVGWIALLVFVVSSLASIIVANMTLKPIALSMQKQKQFVSDAAHELRNPLAALHARIESVTRGPRKDFDKDILHDLLSETKRLIGLSEGLLMLEKGGHNSARTVPQSLRTSIESVLKRLANLADDKKITIRNTVREVSVTMSREDLETILYNLIHNAIKFTPQGGAITLAWTNKSLTVSDTGIGIAKEAIPHIFDRFYKEDTARNEEGNGLGLAIVQDLVEKYGGTVTVQSTLGEGAMFRVTFS